MKRLFVLLLALAMMLSTSAMAAVTEPGALPIVDEPYTLKVWFSKSYDNYDYSPEVNTAIQWMEQQTGIDLDMTIVNNADAATLKVLALTEDLPDVFWNVSWSVDELNRYGMDEGYFIQLDDLIEEHGYYFNSAMEEFGPGMLDSMRLSDGHIYGIPDTNDCYHCSVSRKLWVNQEWQAKLGIEDPETLDEFYDMLVAFRDQDPNGNGIKDEIPLSGATSGWRTGVFEWILNAYLPYNEDMKMMYLDDGVIKGSVTDERYREGLRFIKKLYDDGLLDPAALTQKQADLITVAMSETPVLGATTAGHTLIFLDGSNVERASMYDTISPVAGPDGRRATAFHDPAVATGARFVITDACENPEIAFRFVDFMYTIDFTITKSYGVEGVSWEKLPEDTDLVAFDGTPAYAKLKEGAEFVETGAGTVTDRLGGAPNRNVRDYFYGWMAKDGTENVYESANIESLLFIESAKYIDYADIENTIPRVLDNTTEEAEELAQLWTMAKNYITASRVAFITGEKDLDADWDAYVEELNNSGFARCIELVQAGYDARYGE